MRLSLLVLAAASLLCARASADEKLVATPLSGPFPSVQAWCDSAVKQGVRCRVDEPWGEKQPAAIPASGPVLDGRLFLAEDTSFVAPARSCVLGLRVKSGWFFRDFGHCDGMAGPSHSLHTTRVEPRWTGPVLQLVSRVRSDVGTSDLGPHGERIDGTTSEESESLVLCGVDKRGTPRCTPAVTTGCSVNGTFASFHPTFEKGVLQVRVKDSEAQCDDGREQRSRRWSVAFR